MNAQLHINPHGPLPDGYMLPETDNHAYQIVRTLGEGGCGVTYLAQNLKRFQIPDTDIVVEEGEYLAIKECFTPDYMYRDETGDVHIKPQCWETGILLRRQFYSEAHYLCELADVNWQSDYMRFVPYYHVAAPVGDENAVDVPGIYYLVMPYLSGGTLQALRGNWDAFQIAIAMYDLLCTLQILHGYNVYHLDIKPENIMVGDENRPVLIDFGMTVQNRANGDMGYTMAYVAPEQLREVAITPESGPLMDMYSLGVSFYEILTGKLPPNAKARAAGVEVEPLVGNADLTEKLRPFGEEFEAEYQRRFGRLYPLRSQGMSFAQGLLESVDIAMSMDPEERLNSTEWLEELFAGLNPYMVGETEQSSFNWRMVWVAGLVLALLVILVVLVCTV